SNSLKKPEIYPNPSNQYVTLNLPNKSNASVQVYSIQGQLMASFNSDDALDISKLVAGIYTIVVKQADFIWTEKFLKN
ncbi:MAG: T9SS type A sorting domain-containing protein, partial [Sediminibacterium sp.]|nr:T9SS type A sorting domain-containing protein [Sediminibacterium sp.]